MDKDKSIKARWEWRSFSVSSLNSIVGKLRRLPLGNHKESCDLYVLSSRSCANVKIRRDGLLDVKVMKERREYGCELWLPDYRCRAPYRPENLAKLAEYYALPLPALKREAYSMTEFLCDLVPSWGGLRQFSVSKSRDIYAVDDVILEVGDISLSDRRYRTFCVESENIESVLKVVHGFELEREQPLNYLQLLMQNQN